MKKIKYMLAFCALTVCFSCQNANNDINIDLPDKVIKNMPGTLRYNKDEEEIKGWYISSPIPGTIDSIDCYLIAEISDKEIQFEEGKQVLVSGFCYHIPGHIFADKDLYGLAGLEWYYIKITDLKYKEKLKEFIKF